MPYAIFDDEMAAHLNVRLPEDLVTIYRDHNGIQSDWDRANWRLGFTFRLMSCEEVMANHQLLRDYEAEHPEYWFPLDARYFWMEGNSDYAGVYLSGSLAGKVCLYDHEDPNFAPRFRSVANFCDWYNRYLAALNAMETPDDLHSWHNDNVSADYPLLEDAPETDAADLALAQELTTQFNAITDRSYETRRYRHYLGFSAMNLLPFSASNRLLEFTYNDDMWIQARACELLGKRRYLAAIPRLAEVVQEGTHNGRLAADYALKQMQPP
jgi:hypothetical protein